MTFGCFANSIDILVEKFNSFTFKFDHIDHLIYNGYDINNKSKTNNIPFKKINYKNVNDPIFPRIISISNKNVIDINNKNNNNKSIKSVNDNVSVISSTDSFDNKNVPDILNISTIFNLHQKECVNKYKNNNGMFKTCNYQSRFLSFINFVSNSSYWTRFNVDVTTNKISNPEYIKGKYLNEIYNFYNKKGLYDNVYKYMIMTYLQLTIKAFAFFTKLYFVK